MIRAKRIGAIELKKMLDGRHDVLLVGVFGDESAYRTMSITDSILQKEFESRMPTLKNDQTVVFYCGGSDDSDAAQAAEKALEKGFLNATVLTGGVEDWKKAGLAVGQPVSPATPAPEHSGTVDTSGEERHEAPAEAAKTSEGSEELEEVKKEQ